MNKGKTGADKNSRFKGVCLMRNGKWRANVRLKGVKYSLGTFHYEAEAALAYNAFIKAHCIEHGYLNPISTSMDDEPMRVKAASKLQRSPKKERLAKPDNRVPRELLEALGVPLEDKRTYTPGHVFRRKW